MESFDEDELIIARADERRNTMECFIIENGVERQADLEDLLPLLAEQDGGASLQYFLRDVMDSEVNLAVALAFLPNETLEILCHNMSIRNGGRLRKETKRAESFRKEYIQQEKQKLIDFLGKFEKEIVMEGWYSLFPKNVIWKETKLDEDRIAKNTPLESLKKRFDDAINTRKLDLSYYSDKITQDDIRSAFQDRLNDLQKIQQLEIKAKDLPAAALLFKKGKIENLSISSEFDGKWPSFLENCSFLTELIFCIRRDSEIKLTELPSWVRNASSLSRLSILDSDITLLPEWIGELQSLTELSLYNNKNMEALPDSIGNLKNLESLYTNFIPIKNLPDSIVNLKNLKILSLRFSDIEEIPNWLGDLKSLTELFLGINEKMESLPDSIGNLTNLTKLYIDYMPIKKLPDSIGNLRNLQIFSLEHTSVEKLPDSIGNLQSLTELLLKKNSKLTTLPDSIGNLKNLTKLDLGYTPIEKLPNSIVNCTALKYVNIFGTKITSVPDFIKSINCFNDNTVIEIIPQGRSISYHCFCNSYNKLANTILAFNNKARREGLLALEEELESLADGFFKLGIRLVVYGTDTEIIRDVLRIKLEHEHDYYRKKLMEIALEGIINIQNGDSPLKISFLLASLVNIEKNPLASACAKYLCGYIDALDNVDFYGAMQNEDEREEISLIKRAVQFSEKARREGILALEELLDKEKITARDVFEYGIVLVIDNWDFDFIRKLLDRMIANEIDPVRKNLAQAKMEAVLSIGAGDNSRILIEKLCAYFGDDIYVEFKKSLDWD